MHIIADFNDQQDAKQNVQQFWQKFSIEEKYYDYWDKKYKYNYYKNIDNINKIVKKVYNEPFLFSKFEIESEVKIRSYFEQNIKEPTINDVEYIPLITLNDNKVEVFFESLKKIENLADQMIQIKNKKTHNKSTINQLEKTIDNLLISMKDIKGMFILNRNDFPYLNNALKEIENEISNFILNLEKFNDNYKKSIKDILYEFFNFNKNSIFSLDFSLPELPEKISITNISLYDIDINNSKNLCLPFITLFSKEKKLISSFISLDINLNVCPTLYNGFYTIKIISFVNEEMRVKLNKDNKEKELKTLIKSEEDNEIDYLLVKNKSIKNGEDIQLLVNIPQIVEEILIKQRYILYIKTIDSKQKLNLNVDMNLAIVPISLLLSCKEYNLIKEDYIEDNNIKYEHWFKLDTYELLSDEIINFELLNYKREEPLEFYLSVKRLRDNTSNIPKFDRRKQKNNFNIKIPEYVCKNNETEFPRLQYIFNIQINKYCVIHIKIDALIRPILNIFKIYDFNSKNYVENQMQIYLDQNDQKLLKKYYEGIKLNCILYSTLENNSFLVSPEPFEGGYFTKKQEKEKNIIKYGKCKFTLQLEFSENKIIQNGTECNINISIKEKTIPFKIIFLYKNNDYINNEINLSNKQNEINNINNSQNNDIKYYYIDYEGNITSDSKYNPIIEENNNTFFKNMHFPSFFPFYTKKSKVPFCFRYKQFWYPLITKNGNICNNNSPYFEAWKRLERQDDIYLVNNLKEKIKNDMKNFKEGIDDLTFERLAYHILFNTENTLFNLHGLFPNSIKEILNTDYNLQTHKIGEEKNLALFHYIIKFQKIFNEHKLLNPKIFSYYSNEQDFLIQDEYPSNIIKSFEDKLKSFKHENNTKIKSSKNYLIKGNITESFDENRKPEIDESNNEINLIPNNKCDQITLPEINLDEYKKFCSIDFIFNFYKNLKMGTIIFPFYLQLTIINKSEEKNSKKLNNYFDALFTVYSSVIKNNKENKNKSIVYSELKEFISSYEALIVKLKKEGIDMRNNILNSINDEMYNKNSFLIKPKQIELIPQNDDLGEKKNNEEKKEVVENEENNINHLIKQIENDNLKSEKKRKIEFEIKASGEREGEANNIENNKNKNSKESDESEEEEDEQLGDKNPKTKSKEKPNLNEDFGKEKEKAKTKDNIFYSSEEKNKKPNSKKHREKLNNLEKNININEDHTIKYIIDKMLHESELEIFKYELSKKENKGYDKSNSEYYELKPNEILPITNLIKISRFLSSKIYNTVANINSTNQTKYEILFNKIEANILLDVAQTIKDENRFLNLLMICGLVTALNSLKISYSLSLIGDSDFKIKLKSSTEPHSDLILQKLFDCCFIKRNLTQLATCLRYFIDDNEKNNNNNKNMVYYIFTNGYDDELIKYNAWKRKIFNNKKNSFAFVISRNIVRNDNINSENFNFIEKKFDEFSNEVQKANSKVTVSKTSLNEILNDYDETHLNFLAENLSQVLIREIEPNNKNNSPKLNAIFKINKSELLKKDFINNFIRLLKDSDILNDPRFNDIYIKRNKMPNIYDRQKEKQSEFKEYCQQIGKIFGYDNLYDTTLRDIKCFANSFKEKKERINLKSMNIIFKPNQATQYKLEEEGTHLDIIEIIKYYINPVPNPKLYREKTDGFIKNYAVSIILDTSISCLNELCIIHTLQTLRILLNAISYDNLLCLDIILTTDKEPIILASEKTANEILKEKSPFWAALCSGLNGCSSSDLASAIKASYNINRARKAEYTSYLFVLTDGLYNFSERDRIIEVVNTCYSKNINVFGIGVGICPFGIEKLFPQVIYSRNPYKLIEGISLFFEDLPKYNETKFNFIEIGINIEQINKELKELPKYIKNPKYKKLKEELSKIVITQESYPFYIPELPMNEDGSNPKGELYPEKTFLGQKILIAMFFSSDLKSQQGEVNSEIEEKVKPEYITIPNKKGEDCIKSLLEYYGYEVVVVTSYIDAIEQLCSTNEEDKCEYNSLWVISGQEFPDLPKLDNNKAKSKEDKENDPYYVESFVDCAIKFWNNGGSLFLMGENDPYNFQVNLFLKKLIFHGNKKVNFYIGGNHKGGNIIKQYDENGNLSENMTFSRKIEVESSVERPPLAYNIYSTYEGSTVAFANGDDIKPFIPFCKDSEKGIISMFYNGRDKGDGTGEGDIVIDCGYTKFFLEMKTTGTSQYLKNIGGFLGSAQRRARIESILNCPGKYRPDKVEFTFIKNDPKYFYNYPKIPYDIVYLVDATGSMQNSINNVIEYCIDIAGKLKKKIKYADLRFGAVFYRDPVDSKEDYHQIFDLNPNVEKLQSFVKGINATGGGDGPEDWVGGYKIILNKINWREGMKKIIHIADAGAHGRDYSDGDKYSDENKYKFSSQLDTYIRECARKRTHISALQIGDTPKKSFSRVQKLYKEENNNNFSIQSFDQNLLSPENFPKLVVEFVTKVTLQEDKKDK